MGKPILAGCSIIVAAIFYFFDGFAAGLLKTHSDTGLQLVSLAYVERGTIALRLYKVRKYD